MHPIMENSPTASPDEQQIQGYSNQPPRYFNQEPPLLVPIENHTSPRPLSSPRFQDLGARRLVHSYNRIIMHAHSYHITVTPANCL